jgi:proteasome lid subunit RPN8/RPN11
LYPSHPEGGAHWSAADLAEACWPGCAYLILGLKNGSVDEMKCFLLECAEGRESADGAGKKFVPVELRAVRG